MIHAANIRGGVPICGGSGDTDTRTSFMIMYLELPDTSRLCGRCFGSIIIDLISHIGPSEIRDPYGPIMLWPEAAQRNRLLRSLVTPIGETEPVILHPGSDTEDE